MESSKEVWDEFFKRYYWEQILGLANQYPDTKSLWIEFGNLERFDMAVARELLEFPDGVLRHATESLRGLDLPADTEITEAHVRIEHLPELTLIRDIRSTNINKLIAVTGLVRKATEVRPKVTNAAFRCARCGDITYLAQEDHVFVEPFECGNDSCGRKGRFKLVPGESDFIDFQKIRIQDSPDEVRPGEQPQTLDASAVEDITGKVSPGDRVVIVGILRSYQRVTQQGKSTAFDLILETVSVETEEKGFEEIEVTKEDEQKIKELSTDPDIYTKLMGSVAPSIYGYSEVKEAMTLQLFGGLPVATPDGLKIRGDIHVLLVGDPGVAKSQCLRYSRRLSPRGVFTSGKGSSAAGLTATAVKDNEFGGGRWTLEAGALVLADMGLACVDELDKMEVEDRSAMHEALEQQTVTINKAGIHATLRARCSVLGAANPKYGRFDKYEPIGKQINLPPTLLSRFDLIFIIRDEPNIIQDTAVSAHIFKTHIAGELALRRKNVRNSGITEEQVTEAMSTIKPVFDVEFLRKYIAYARRTSYPLIQPDARKMLNDFYLSLRKLGEDPNTPLPVTARQLEALIRCAEASARTRLSSEATIEDARRVIRIVEVSLNQVIRDPETGNLDSDLINTGIGRSQRDRLRIVLEAVRSLQGANGNSVPIDLLTQTLEKEGLKKEYILDVIAKLKTAGDLIEVSSDRFRVV